MIAHLHGKVLNASQIAGAFGVSYHTVNNYIDLLENYFLIHKLLPYHANIGKRLIKRPKLYFRDTGLLHYLLHISSKEDLRVSPYRGFSFEGFVIESLIQQVLIHEDVQCRFYYYRTAQGDEIDLLMHRGDTLIAYEMKTSTSVDMHEIKGFIRCLDQLKIKRGIIVYFGKEDYKVNSRIEVKSVYNLF